MVFYLKHVGILGVTGRYFSFKWPHTCENYITSYILTIKNETAFTSLIIFRLIMTATQEMYKSISFTYPH